MARKNKGRRLAETLAGRYGAVEPRTTLYESDIEGREVKLLEGATDVGISLSNYRDHAFELSFTLDDNPTFKPLTGYVKAIMQIKTSPKTWARFPLGLYRFKSPEKEHSSRTRQKLRGRSLEVLPLEDFVGAYTVEAGTGVLAAARTLLASMTPAIPSTRINFPTTDVLLKTPMYFDPFTDSSRCYRLRIINALLAAGGFYGLYTDKEGRFTTTKIPEFTTETPDVFYASRGGVYYEVPAGSLGGEVLVSTEDISDHPDDENFANQIVVLSSDTNTTPQIMAIAENRNPNSPFSIQNLGRIKAADPITLQNIVSLEEATLYAKAALRRASGLYRRVTIKTVVDPRRGQKEVYGTYIELPDGSLAVSGKWRVIGWQIDGSSMSHELARVEEDIVQPVFEVSYIAANQYVVWGDWSSAIDYDPPLFIDWGQEDIFLDEITETFEELD